MKVLFLLIFCIPNWSLVSAQSEINRYEIDLDNQYSECKSTLFGKNGVLTYCKEIKPSGPNFRWKLIQLDTNLQVTKEGFLTVDKFAILEKTSSDNNYCYFLFTNPKKVVALYRVNLKTLSVDYLETKMQKKYLNAEICSYKDAAFCLLQTQNKNELIKFDYASKSQTFSSIVYGRYDANTLRIDEHYFDTINLEIVTTIKTESDQYQNLYASFRHSIDNKLNSLFDPNLYTDKQIRKMCSNSTEFGVQVYSGTYSNKESDCLDGVFFIEVKNNINTILKFIKLEEIEAFQRYLKHGENGSRELNKAKRDVILDVQTPKKIDSLYIIISELYRPAYSTNAGASILFGVAGSMATTKFAGYDYQGSNIICVNENSVQKWDLFLNMYPYERPMKLNHQVRFSPMESGFKIIYPEGKIGRMLEIDKEGNIHGQQNVNLSQPEIEHKVYPWYKNTQIEKSYFDKYIVFNAESISDKTIVKHRAFYLQKRTFKLE